MSKNPTESTSAANQLSMAQNETVSIIRANSLALSDAYFDNLKSHCELVSTYIEQLNQNNIPNLILKIKFKKITTTRQHYNEIFRAFRLFRDF